MALNIKNADLERRVREIVSVTGETKTEAIRRALEERKGHLEFQISSSDRRRRIQLVLAEVWRAVPAVEMGRRMTRAEEEAILGYGPEGV